MTEFQKKVVEVVSCVPAGKVVAYGQVAVYVGVPRGARQVGWILRQMKDGEVPWWRVVNNAGRISIKGNWFVDANNQRELLRKESVVVSEDYKVDMSKFRYMATQELLAKWQLPEEYLQMVWEKFGVGN